MHIVILGLCYVVATVVASLAGLIVVRRLVGVERLQAHHDVAGFIFAIVGVIYAVLLAFVVIVVWEQFEAAEEKATQEATSVATLYRLAHGFPTTVEKSFKSELRDYDDVVITQEWPAMDHFQETPRADDIVNELYETLDTVQPTTDQETSVYMAMMTELNQFSAQRTARVLASREGLPAVMWVVLFFGAFTTIAFTYFFGPENFTALALMVSLLSAMIGLMLFLIWITDHPFSGDLRVGPEAFEHVGEMMKTIDERDQMSSVVTSHEWKVPPRSRPLLATEPHS
jgi:hypothetical protein